MGGEEPGVRLIAIMPGVRFRSLVRGISYLQQCLPRCNFVLLSFTCDIVPYPHLSDNSHEITPSDPDLLIQELNLLTDSPDFNSDRLCIITPFPRPLWRMTHSKQPKNCHTTPESLTSKVQSLYEKLIKFCIEKNLYCFDIYKHFGNIDFVYNDIHLSSDGKRKLKKLMLKQFK